MVRQKRPCMKQTCVKLPDAHGRQTCNAATVRAAAEHDFERLCVLAIWTDRQHADPRRYRICKAIDKYSKTVLLAVQNLPHRYIARTLSCRLMWRKTFSQTLLCPQRRTLQTCDAKGNANRDVAAVDEEPARVHQEKS